MKWEKENVKFKDLLPELIVEERKSSFYEKIN